MVVFKSLYDFFHYKGDIILENKFNLTKEQSIFLAKKTLVTNIYNSAKLEGVNTTFPETQTILDGVNVPNLKLDEINCILNLRDAWKYVINNVDANVDLDFICKVNGYVSRNESLEWGYLEPAMLEYRELVINL